MTWKTIYGIAFGVIIAVDAGILYWAMPGGTSNNGVLVAGIWGITALVVALIVMLGAATSQMHFLVLFMTGLLGAGVGYLVGVWLSPQSSAESEVFQRVSAILGTLLAGAVGAKLLSLWDGLVADPAHKLLTTPYYSVFISGLAGAVISLTVFYTIRRSTEGSVVITASPGELRCVKEKLNGVPTDNAIQFSAAASNVEDVSVTWELRPTIGGLEPASSLNATTGLLQPMGDDWAGWDKVRDKSGALPPNALDWVVVATSNFDRSKAAEFPIHLCAKGECTAPKAKSASDSGRPCK